MGLEDPNLEGFAVAQELLGLFWNRTDKQWQARNNSSGTLDDQGHFAIWPVSIGVQAIVDAARVNPGYLDLVGETIQSFGRYYDPRKHAYTAFFYTPGNEDIYYDDNAQVASALITAYEVTRDNRLLDLGRDNVDFLMTGKDTGPFGGVRWHVGKQGSNTCTTAEVGIACMQLSRNLDENSGKKYIEFAQMCAEWLFTKIQDPGDHLMCDGLEPDGNSFKRNDAKWTYNQGTPLSLCGYLYEATKDEKYFKWARSLAEAASDPNTALFDRDTPDHNKRYYRDSLTFYQLLAEGFANYLLFFGDMDTKVAEQVKQAVYRHVYYIYTFLRLPNGRPQYSGTLELYRIDKERYDVFKKMTGENKDYQPAKDEHEGSDVNKPLTANFTSMASAARVFFQSARVVPKVNFS